MLPPPEFYQVRLSKFVRRAVKNAPPAVKVKFLLDGLVKLTTDPYGLYPNDEFKIYQSENPKPPERCYVLFKGALASYKIEGKKVTVDNFEVMI